MKRIISTAVILTLSFVAFAQGNALMKRIQSLGSAQMGYSLSVDDAQGREVLTQKGTLYYQNGSYRVESDAMEIFCDGKSRWIYTKSSEEVVVMKNDYKSSSPVENPMLLMSDSKVKDNGNGTYRVVYTDSNDFHYRLSVSSVKESPKHPASFFVLDESSLSDDTIVTDLR